MSDRDDIKTENQASETTDGTEKSRRRFLVGGLATAPVILTLSNRPAWAGGSCTESGMLSGGVNLSQGIECGGEGCSPGFWRTHPEQWYPGYQPTDLFLDVFGRDAFPGATLGEVIAIEDLPPNQWSILPVNPPGACSPDSACHNLLRSLGFQTVAALQNAATGVSFDLNTNEVKDYFQLAYDTGTKTAIESTKNMFDTLNNQGCPLSR